ncbi:zinc finger, CCHC-type containing protein [Tanacetum coccineum]
MENANPPPNNRPVLTAALRARAVQELYEPQIISAFVDSLLEGIEQFLNNFGNQPNETDMNNLEFDDELEDLTIRFLAQFFLPERTAKLRNDILMLQQHQGESLSETWTRFKDLLQKVPHHGIDLWLQVQIFYDHVTPATRRTIDQSAGGKLRDRNAVESWALLEDLALYDDKSWNDLRDFAKPVKQISLPQDVPNTSDRRLSELEN